MRGRNILIVEYFFLLHTFFLKSCICNDELTTPMTLSSESSPVTSTGSGREREAAHTGRAMRSDEALKQYGFRRRMCRCSAGVKGRNPVIFVEQHFCATINRKWLILDGNWERPPTTEMHLTYSSSCSSETRGEYFTGGDKVAHAARPSTGTDNEFLWDFLLENVAKLTNIAILEQ